MVLKKLIASVLFSIALYSANSTTYTVTNTNDAGAGSLRQAITDVNIYPGTHTIAFNIPTSDPNYISAQGVWRITPQTTLPIIMRSNLLIDGTTQTTNQGNTNPDGPEILLDGNHQFGSDFAFHVYNSAGVIIQGFIIGRFTVGIEMSGSSSQNNIIRGNYIGCNYNATDTLSNTHGIEILSGPHNNTIGGSTVSDRNILSGNNHTGIRVVNSNSNIIKGNYVGLNRTGNAALRNYDGISIEGTSKYNMIGGYIAADRNNVSGNVAYGIPVFGGGCFYNIIAGNYIGTDITGSFSVPNTYGVLFDDGASYNMLGGKTAGAGNLLSGNSGYGVFLYNPGTQKDTVLGNLIGTNWNGTLAIPNANGIVIDGPSYKHIIDSNVISGNSQMGISIHIGGTDSNVIIRNKIGTDITGVNALANSIDGVRIGEGPQYNIIGKPGMGNIIAFNGQNGISVLTAAERYNRFSENSIYGNGALGIDLYPAGANPNDAGDIDTGPNDGMNYPVIDSLRFIAGSVIVCGHADVQAPLQTKVEIFLADPDITGYGEGKTWLGSTFPLNDGTWRDTVVGVTPSDFLTATATDNLGNTSEFSFDFPYPPVSIYENDNDPFQIEIIPNPFDEVTQLKITCLAAENLIIQADIYNFEGSFIKSAQAFNGKITVDGKNMKSGIYFCRIQLNGGRYKTVRLIKM
jgi:parallel beta-helix repeat protein